MEYISVIRYDTSCLNKDLIFDSSSNEYLLGSLRNDRICLEDQYLVQERVVTVVNKNGETLLNISHSSDLYTETSR